MDKAETSAAHEISLSTDALAATLDLIQNQRTGTPIDNDMFLTLLSEILVGTGMRLELAHHKITNDVMGVFSMPVSPGTPFGGQKHG
ncbi:hypothetical protein GIY62_14630 [Burkholderia plantarii]|uniref:hypothetical protein n=1 Tax=Burkholderia plantarii TaxID=41899 RepID=UPI00272CBD8F|nr:hypothetical protein [Burkholderia plantarii]WLE58362.1 hypothetical protein GIY62_14630 [Burkholderia plantarii]